MEVHFPGAAPVVSTLQAAMEETADDSEEWCPKGLFGKAGPNSAKFSEIGSRVAEAIRNGMDPNGMDTTVCMTLHQQQAHQARITHEHLQMDPDAFAAAMGDTED